MELTGGLAELEIAAGHWLFSDDFSEMTNQISGTFNVDRELAVETNHSEIPICLAGLQINMCRHRTSPIYQGRSTFEFHVVIPCTAEISTQLMQVQSSRKGCSLVWPQPWKIGEVWTQ